MNTLYQFTFSHFCEKARWALEYKEQDYRVKNLLPGPHQITTKKLAPNTCVPILDTGEEVIQESSAIIDYLDSIVPIPLLTPRDPEQARETREWERYLDEEIGVTLRCWFYFHALPDREIALNFILRDGPWYGGPLYALIFPKVREVMMEHMQINAHSARDAEARMVKAFARLNERVRDHRFLVGNQFSRADLTACALLWLLCMADAETLNAFPEAVAGFHRRHADQPFFRWAVKTYREFRTPLRKAA